MLLLRSTGQAAPARQAVAPASWRQLVSSTCREVRSAFGGNSALGVPLAHQPSPKVAPTMLGLARAGSMVAMSLANDEVLAAAYTSESPSSSSLSSVGLASTSSSGTLSGSSTASSLSSAASGAQLSLASGCFVLPHPDKVLKGGEDWYFIAKNSKAVGVADGVGGWSEIGVDAGAYARELMEAAGVAADSSATTGQELSPQAILEEAYTKTSSRGSCTACIAALTSQAGRAPILKVSNLGDSGVLLLRGGKVVFHTPQQQHGFNFPYQIGSADSMSDVPQAAEQYEVAVQPGDVIVLGTDGLWDNCFDEEVSSVIKYCQDHGMGPEKTAQVMAHYARHRASDSKFASPFAYSAFQAGYAYMGGKLDDITVVVSVVTGATN